MSIAELQSAISGCDMPTKLKLVEMLMGDIYSDTDFWDNFIVKIKI